MSEIPAYIATRPEFLNLAATPDTYHSLVLLRRGREDDCAVLEARGETATGDALAVQIAKEMQVAYDAGMAGDFQVLKIGTNLMPQILSVATPATPLSPWQIDFANHYGEEDYAWMETLADTHDAGDTIFTAVMLELDAKEDCDSPQEALRRLDSIIDDLMKVRDAIASK